MCDFSMLLGPAIGFGLSGLLGAMGGREAAEGAAPDTSAALDLQRRALAEATRTRKMTEDAMARAEAAMVDPRDSEAARRASEAAMRKRKQQAPDIFAGGQLGPANVGVATLFGQ